jgi:protein-S-isoprenylcysteine O-methyltransferase Ste14
LALIHEYEDQGNVLFRNRSWLPILILLPALLVYLHHQGRLSDTELMYQDTIRYISVFIGLLGLGIRMHVVGHSAPNTSGRNTNEGQVADSLNSTGMYSVVRHPLYLGNFLMWLAPAIWTLDLWFILFFIVLYWLYYERIMFAEEAFLRGKFGATYDVWAKGRPPFIPRLSGYVKADIRLSWKKVLKKERNGFAALFVIFWAFDLLPKIIHGQWNGLEMNFWTLSAIGSMAIYLVLKALKRSALLKE